MKEQEQEQEQEQKQEQEQEERNAAQRSWRSIGFFFYETVAY